MTTRPFKQVDVFAALPFRGNPVAVILDASALRAAPMQAIASWTNLSETTFVCAAEHPEADYRLRIFTPRSELPFAGHPTLGSAHAVLEHGLRPRTPGRLVQQCEKGLIALRTEGERIFLALPEPRFTEPSDEQRAAVAAALGIRSGAIVRAAIVDVGPVWFTVQLDSAEAVLALSPDMAALAALGAKRITGVNVFGVYAQGGPAELEVRSFDPADGVPEDPVCGSGNGCVAALIRRDGVLSGAGYVAAQGRCLGRDGRVEVRFEGDQTIWLGGRAVTCVSGHITL